MNLELTKDELRAVQWVTGNHSDTYANDIEEMMAEGMTRNQAKALVRANQKIKEKLGYFRSRKPSLEAAQ